MGFKVFFLPHLVFAEGFQFLDLPLQLNMRKRGEFTLRVILFSGLTESSIEAFAAKRLSRSLSSEATRAFNADISC
jgi:hypothetical protein